MDDYAEFVPKEVNAVSPKIYKGEQYRQLPYVMLDQPRFFKHDDVFAIRSFFWWGNSFSIHLLLGGKYKLMYQDKINRYLQDGRLSSWYIGVSADPWQHHFEQDNYLPITDRAGKDDITHDGNYLKIGKWHGVDDWKGAYAFFISSYKHLLETLV